MLANGTTVATVECWDGARLTFVPNTHVCGPHGGRAACPTEMSAASRAAGRQATRWSWMALVSAAGTSSRSCFTLKSAEHTFAWRAHQALM